MGNGIVPPYTPTYPSPHYSSKLLPGEQTVESTRYASSRSPAGVYRRITDSLAIVLRDQHPRNMYPTYGRNGVVHGEVTFSSNTDVLTSVILKLEGQFLLSASGAPVSTTFLSTKHVLWSASNAQRCPKTIAFEVVFPLTFNDGGEARSLPPTFETGEPRATCTYSLTVELSRPRQFRSLFKGNEAVKIPLVYHPRNRSHLPMLPSDSPVMFIVKSSPEEWHKITCTILMTHGSGLAPVECLLFIPSARVYALTDTIPFHLQIRGGPASLVPFLEPGQDGRQDIVEQPKGGVAIGIYILRQISVRIYGQSTAASCNLGGGEMKPSYSLSSVYHPFLHPLGEGLDSLDWDGVLRCGDVTVPGFATNQFSVKDSVVLSIAPRQPLRSPVMGMKHSCPIQLVTDSWSNDSVV